MRISRLSAIALILLTGLALAAPLAAFPPACSVSCKCGSRCANPCTIGGVLFTCGAYGVCIGECLVASDKSPSSDSLRDAIFAEASPAANQPAAPAK
jgi:hypothetical protein